jgi:hypothetical protein
MSAIDDLKQFRTIVVAIRRDCAAKGSLPEADRADCAAGIKNAQEWIEAIDKAIADEQKLGG